MACAFGILKIVADVKSPSVVMFSYSKLILLTFRSLYLQLPPGPSVWDSSASAHQTLPPSPCGHTAELRGGKDGGKARGHEKKKVSANKSKDMQINPTQTLHQTKVMRQSKIQTLALISVGHV